MQQHSLNFYKKYHTRWSTPRPPASHDTTLPHIQRYCQIKTKPALLRLCEADSTLMSDPPTMSYPSYLSPNTLTMFNINNLLNQKDSRWLQLEVCREFQRQNARGLMPSVNSPIPHPMWRSRMEGWPLAMTVLRVGVTERNQHVNISIPRSTWRTSCS